MVPMFFRHKSERFFASEDDVNLREDRNISEKRQYEMARSLQLDHQREEPPLHSGVLAKKLAKVIIG